MCIICQKEYDDNTTEIDCHWCKKVTEIPILPNLQSLYCSNCPWLERNKENFQKRMEKLKIVQKCWREQKWKKI